MTGETFYCYKSILQKLKYFREEIDYEKTFKGKPDFTFFFKLIFVSVMFFVKQNLVFYFPYN